MSAFSAAAFDEDGDTIRALRAAIEQARTWIAEHPDRRPISAGRMVAILTNALADAPQPPVVEQTQVEQELAAEVGVIGWKNHLPNSGAVVHWTELMPSLGTKLYTSPQNLNCKSNQHRLATLWGYVKDQAPTNFEWKNAVIDELVCAHILTQEHETNPRKAIQDAITWNTQVALDPAVSSDAQALIDQGSSAERDRICKIVYGMCISDNNAFEIVQAIKDVTEKGASNHDAKRNDSTG